jgi:hypothetical protein
MPKLPTLPLEATIATSRAETEMRSDRMLLVNFATRSIRLPSTRSWLNCRKDLTKVPDAELKKHFDAINRA